MVFRKLCNLNINQLLYKTVSIIDNRNQLAVTKKVQVVFLRKYSFFLTFGFFEQDNSTLFHVIVVLFSKTSLLYLKNGPIVHILLQP